MINKSNRLSSLGVLSIIMSIVGVVVIIAGVFILSLTFLKTNKSDIKSLPTTTTTSDEKIAMPLPSVEQVGDPKTKAEKQEPTAAAADDCPPARSPDVVSEKAQITDYYRYVDGKWVWSE